MEPITYQTPESLQLRLKIPAGQITVSAEETRETLLAIDGERSPDDLRISFDAEPSGGHRLAVDHRAKGIHVFGSHDLDVRVTVPVGTLLEVETGSADLDVRGEIGDVAFRSGSGDVRLDSVNGDLAAKVASGDLIAGSVRGDVAFHGASGDALVGPIGGGLVARTASGDMRVASVDGSAQATTVSGDLALVVSAGSTNLRTVSGDVEVGVRQGTKVFLDLLSTSGDVRSELGDDLEPMEGPDLELTVVSVSGDIHVRSASAAGTPL
jgi:DUF4097 and DUF4098 domain-containing protein YvlB